MQRWFRLPWLRLLVPLIVSIALLVTACGQQAAPPAQSPSQGTKKSDAPAAKAQAPAPAAATTSAVTPEPKPKQKLKVAYTAVSANIWPLMYGQKAGIFAAEGVDLELQNITGVPQIVATLISGDIDAAFVGFDGMAGAVAQGADNLRYVGEFVREFTQDLVVAPGTNAITDLKGKPVAGAGAGSLSDTLFLEGLKKGGIADPVKETQYFNVAGGAARLTQLLNGTVVGAALNAPFVQQAEEKGFKVLQYQGKLLDPWAGQGVIVKAETAAAKRDAIRGLIKGLQRSVTEMNAKKPEAVAVASEYLKLDPALTEKVHAYMMPAFADTGRWNLEGVQRVLDSKSKGKKLDAAKYVDDSFLK